MTGIVRDFFGTIHSRTVNLSAFRSHLSERANESASCIALKLKRKMVGAAGFEPTTP